MGRALEQAVRQRSQRARSAGALHSLPSEPHVVEQAGIPFVVRVLAGLEARAEAARLQQRSGADPFLPYEEELFVAELSASHVCLLNKYNVVDHHLLIVTREFVAQETLLDARDFEALQLCLDEIEGLGFYNSSATAGASQSHKHLQLIPLPLDASPLDASPEGAQRAAGERSSPGPGAQRASKPDRARSEPQASGVQRAGERSPAEGARIPLEVALGPVLSGREPGVAAALPFVHAVVALAEPPRADATARAELRLETYRALRRATGLVRDDAPYNLLMTREWMLLVPRTRESWASVSVNALGFAGSLLVRSGEELERVRRAGPLEVLRQVGVSRPC